jgi:hypothetical protein
MISLQNLILDFKNLVSQKRTKKHQDQQANGENPWQKNLERLALEQGVAKDPASEQTVEEQFQQIIEQAKQDKVRETLKKRQEYLQSGGQRPIRASDKTVTDQKAWWGQAVATWNPEDSKNVTFEDRKLPKQHKWFS